MLADKLKYIIPLIYGKLKNNITYFSTNKKRMTLEYINKKKACSELEWEKNNIRELNLKAIDCLKQNKEEEANDYWKQAASHGCSEALFQLGCYYQKYEETTTAKSYFDKAASLGHKEALCNLGCIYEQEKDFSKAEDLYLRAYLKGDTVAGINLGGLYLKNKNYMKAENILKPIAQKGSSKALLILGELYRKTNQTNEAKQFLIKASEGGQLEALYLLGIIYNDEDPDKAKKYYKAAADRGDEKAQTMLGIIHFEAGDLITAKQYYKLAIQKNEPTALYNLAHIEAEEGNYAEAKRLYKLAAGQNFPGAKARLSWIESIESFTVREVAIVPYSRFLDYKDVINEHIKIIKEEIQRSQRSSIYNVPAIPLCSSFEEKSLLRDLGAKWCAEQKAWFIPFTFTKTSFHKYLPLIYNQEKKNFIPSLVPRNLWFKNLRSFLPSKTWDELRLSCYKSTNYRCSVCGVKGNLHCDEVWDYEVISPKEGIVHFEKIWPLCARCHRVKHFGKAEADNLGNEAFARMLFINELSIEEGEDIINKAYQRWEKLSQLEWKFNFQKLKENYDISLE